MAMRPGTYAKADRAVAERDAMPEYEDDLDLLVGYFEDSEEATTAARRLSERDRDYYDNKQLDRATLETLKKRGQPDIIINRIQTKVNYLLGYEASQRADPRGYPRTQQDEDAAAACSDALRYLGDKLEYRQIFSDAWESMLVEGFGGVELSVVPDAEGSGGDIEAEYIPWDRLFYDPHSRRADFSDARYLGTVVWMDKSEAVAKWPDHADAIEQSVATDRGKTYDDRPSWRQWSIHGKRPRVRICQMYYLKGKAWRWCIFTKGAVLDSGDVPFVDADGKSLCPLIMQSSFVDRKNDRYGFVRALIGPQDEINKRRSKMLHQSMVRQVKYVEGAFEDEEKAREELAKADGFVKINPGFENQVEVLSNTTEFGQQAELLKHATNEIDLMGPNAVMSGKGERGASGRAKLVDQQGGQIEIYRLIDRHQHFKRRVYKLTWAMVRQYWTAPKWVRVTDDDKNTNFVRLNKPVKLADKLLKQAISNGVPEEEAKAQLVQQAQDPFIKQQLQQVVGYENVPADMEMDIILEDVPDSANVAQEQFEILVQLAQAGIKFPPQVYIKASALRDKTKLLEELEKASEDPGEQEKSKALMDEMKAKIAKIDAEIAKLNADTIKAMTEADMMDAQIGTIVQPNVIPAGQGLTPMGGAPMPGMPQPSFPDDGFGPPPGAGMQPSPDQLQPLPDMPQPGPPMPNGAGGLQSGGIDPFSPPAPQPLPASPLVQGP